MSRVYVPVAIMERLKEQAKSRCGYCLSSQDITCQILEVDHLQPRSLGGKTVEENLWLACSLCNDIKNKRIEAKDPETGDTVRIFNPRTQKWADHFEWTEGGLLLVGKTPVGRVTVILLDLNRDIRLTARSNWISVGWHPPEEE